MLTWHNLSTWQQTKLAKNMFLILKIAPICKINVLEHKNVAPSADKYSLDKLNTVTLVMMISSLSLAPMTHVAIMFSSVVISKLSV